MFVNWQFFGVGLCWLVSCLTAQGPRVRNTTTQNYLKLYKVYITGWLGPCRSPWCCVQVRWLSSLHRWLSPLSPMGDVLCLRSRSSVLTLAIFSSFTKYGQMQCTKNTGRCTQNGHNDERGTLLALTHSTITIFATELKPGLPTYFQTNENV